MYPLENVSFQKTILAMLYWTEGSKHKKISGLKFTNTDPKMIDLLATLLRNCYCPEVNKFYIYLQLHYYHPMRETKKFWLELTVVPVSQFRSITIKKEVTKRDLEKTIWAFAV